VPGLLVVVSRTDPARYKYLKHVFGRKQVFGEAAEVIVDRRREERRRPGHHEGMATERRWGARRQRDISKALETSGWVLIRR